jgi:anthranilate/para-aminobenzoate synthase component II
MLLIITRETPNHSNKLHELYNALDAREIPYVISRKCDPAIIRRKDICGLIIPGARFRIKQYEEQPELDIELYYLFHFPNLPVLGICHGCQFLMVYYGGSLRSYNSLWSGRHEAELNLSRELIFKGGHSHESMHFYFHELPLAPSVSDTNTGVREIAWITRFRDGKRHACAFEFVKDRVYGFMFHPEVINHTHKFLYNFYDNVCTSSISSS